MQAVLGYLMMGMKDEYEVKIVVDDGYSDSGYGFGFGVDRVVGDDVVDDDVEMLAEVVVVGLLMSSSFGIGLKMGNLMLGCSLRWLIS